MPPFDYHRPTDTIAAPRLPPTTAPSALQAQYLRKVDTGPDSAAGARFVGLPAPNDPDGARLIFTQKLLQRERDALMPYVHSEKVEKRATVDAGAIARETADDQKKDDKKKKDDDNKKTTPEGLRDDGEDENGDPLAYNTLASSGGVGALDVLQAANTAPNLDRSSAGSASGSPAASSTPVAAAQGDGSKKSEVPPAATKQDKAAAAADDDADKRYVKSGVPGLVFDREPSNVVRNARLHWLAAAALVFVIALLAGAGTWTAALTVDAGVSVLVGAYLAFHLSQRGPRANFRAAMTAMRDKFRSNPTLWQSALLFVSTMYVLAFALDLGASLAFAMADLGAWTLVLAQITYQAAKHWAKVDLFDQMPADWFEENGGGGRKVASKKRKEVYHVAGNVFSYGDAAQVCASLDAELASYEQVEQAQREGAEWCGYGWSADQMALFPTQTATWAALQQRTTDPVKRQACGRPGVNGGYMPNASLALGVNCFGVKPAATGADVVGSAGAPEPVRPGGTNTGSAIVPPKYTRDQLRLQSYSRDVWSANGEQIKPPPKESSK